MNEENQFNISETPVIPNNGYRNSKGRPRKDKSIEFSAQPKSVISQLLSKMRARNCVSLPIQDICENNTTKNITLTQSTHLSPCPRNDDDTVEEFDIEYEVFTTEKHKIEKNKMNNPGNLKIYSCDFHKCTYSSKLLSNLTKHKRIHTSEKPYLCDRCSFRSNFANSLKAHSRLHTGERPYHCQQCKYQCNSVSNLKKHCLARHKNAPQTTEVT